MADPRTMLPSSSPARYGCFLAGAIGASLVILGLYMFARDSNPMPLRVALLLFGSATAVLAYMALHGSRLGWSFVTAICGTEAVALLFGAPSVRTAADIPLWGAALPSLVFAIATILLAMNSAPASQISKDDS